MPATVSVDAEALIKELAQLWKTLAADAETAPGGGGVLRACAMTLVAVADASRDLAGIDETIAALMHEHPSRAISIQIAAGDAPLASRVFAQCWLPFGRRQQICCEQIELTAGQGAASDVAPLLRGLVVPDLPVVVWGAVPQVLDAPELAQVLALATDVLFDSEKAGDPLAFLGRRREEGKRLGYRPADLAWTRLTRWRESVAQAFETAESRERIACIREVTIEHTTPEPPVGARYLAAWIRRSLGREIGANFRRVEAEQVRTVAGVHFSGKTLSIGITRAGGTLELQQSEGASAQGLMPHYGEYELLREELSILGRDPMFEGVLEDLLR